ncbi:MAG: hypothetical protein DCF30_19170 [Hyphomicrobiales bacterium]|nr:MAG: hypothetical protein DCF30_19170 [Hyphomicrobiales bacterium]
MRPYPTPPNESARLDALHALKLVGTSVQPHFDAIVSLASKHFGCPIVLVSLIDHDRQWFKAKCGLDVCETARDLAFCNYTILDSELFVVPDASKDERFSDNPLVTASPNIRFYAGYPLSLDDEHRVGSFCVIDTVPRSFSATEKDALIEFGQIVESLIESHAHSLALAVAVARSKLESRELETKNTLLLQAERMAEIGAWALDLQTLRTTWSDEVFRLHDLPVGMPPTLDEALSFYPEASRHIVETNVQTTIETGKPFVFETDFVTATGRKRRIRSSGERQIAEGEQARLVGVFQDVTVAHEAREKLWKSANIDFLTGVANRARFQDSLAESFAAAKAEGSSVSLLLLDLDGFKEINDTRGHQAGDDVLKMVAERLVSRLPPGGMVARLGGDEFAIILPRVGSAGRQQTVARQMLNALKQPIRTMGDSVLVSATIGIATYPGDADTCEALLRCADVALYNGKNRERGAIGCYVTNIVNLFDKRRLAIEKVERAIIGNRLLPFYQPFVHLSDRSIYGYEALARIRNRDGSISVAGDFAEAFSDQRSCRRIGDRMLALVTADIANLRAGGINPGVISLNATEAELHNTDFPERLLNRLDECGIDPGALKLEVTETLFLGADPKAVRTTLRTLSDAGVLIALDDFGTGYSSLSHLRDFPIDQIKIDKSFVFGLGRNAESPAIIKALVELAHTLGKTVVAEGIETEGQYEFLRSIGCDAGQGYLFGKACEVATVTGRRYSLPAIKAGINAISLPNRN